MVREENDKKRFYKRVMERRFWLYFGWILLGFGFSLLILAAVGSFLDIPFNLIKIFIDISLLGIILGSVFSLLLSRLGWSKSIPVDLVLNRLSIALIIISQVLGVGFVNLDYSLRPIDYTQVMLIVGIILVLCGIRFQSSIKD